MNRARKAMVPENYIRRAVEIARQGYLDAEHPVYNSDWDSDAYRTVSGQNSIIPSACPMRSCVPSKRTARGT